MRKQICVAIIFSLTTVLAIQACNNRKAKNYNSKTLVDDNGLTFLNTASESGLTEIEASTMAKSRSKNPRVVKFADMLITDHTKIDDELKGIENDSQIAPIDTISLDKQEMIAELSTKKEESLDKAYIKMMISDHEKAVKLFTDAKKAKISSISKFADKNLPALQAHLDSAKAISKSLK